jgi:hypothetical protein
MTVQFLNCRSVFEWSFRILNTRSFFKWLIGILKGIQAADKAPKTGDFHQMSGILKTVIILDSWAGNGRKIVVIKPR